MDKVLVTGATASQYSREAHDRSTRFGGLLSDALQNCGVSVDVKSMGIESSSKDLTDYDSVLVGMAPITSLSSNKMYTALHTFMNAYEDGKAKVFFDAPEPHLVYQSFKSVLNNPAILSKNLYAKREGYEKVSTDVILNKKILSTIEFLLDGDYDIIVPSVPYYEASRENYGIPLGKSGQFYALNFDSKFKDDFNILLGEQAKYWSAENISSKWSRNISKTIAKPVLGIKRSSYDTNKDYVSRFQHSYGYLLETYKNSTPWWSPNIMLSLSCGAPVFSDWRHTGSLGTTWSGLPHSVEELTHEERYALSVGQKESYLKSAPDWVEQAKFLKEKLIP
jgi:hypothetical protein